VAGIRTAASLRCNLIVGMLAACLLVIGAGAAERPAEEELTMDYRVIEEYYGPEIRCNDWQNAGGKLVPAGGTLQIFAEDIAEVTRVDYPLAGGGDVEIALTFNFERLGEDSSLTVHFGSRKKATSGFRVVFDGQHVTIFHKDNQVFQAESPSVQKESAHTVKLVTLAESYAVYLDDRCLAHGQMDPPYTENEGRLQLSVRGADVRIISCTENFIVHDITFPEWQRTELLYEEPFGAEAFDAQWVCNGEKPTVEGDAYTFRHMSVNVMKQRFTGPIAVDCVATPVPTEEFSAGVTDAIFIWMIDKRDGDLFEYMRGLPNASLRNYLPLPLYWVDLGGTNNKTTRLRKNPGRHLIRQFTDRARLLDRNRSYRITLVQNGNVLEFWVDGKCWIQAYDPSPLTAGYVGFRAYCADLTISNLKIWRIE